MNTDQRIRQQIGDLVIQICVLQQKLDEAEAKIVALTPPAPPADQPKD